jgi:hypothetical protein
MKTRKQIIDGFRASRADILQSFNDVDHWNEYTRKPHEKPIDRDPRGDLQNIVSAIDACLANEEKTGGRGPIVMPDIKQFCGILADVPDDGNAASEPRGKPASHSP